MIHTRLEQREEDNTHIKTIKDLLKLLHFDESRVEAIACVCDCGRYLLPGETCHCMNDE